MTDRNPQPLILVTNDDGIEAEGLAALVASVESLGEIFVVAPRHQQSAVSQAITMREPLRVSKTSRFGDDVKAISLTGTPADCVKFACHKWLDRRPSLVVSGINHGPNTAVNVLYSGTVGGAAEGSVMGIPSIAFSLDHSLGGQDFRHCKSAVTNISGQILKEGLPDGIFLNVNIPHLAFGKIKGVKVVRTARSRWEEYFEERKDPGGNSYYWLDGSFRMLDTETNQDVDALKDGFVAVTPLTTDWTEKSLLESMSKMFSNE